MEIADESVPKTSNTDFSIERILSDGPKRTSAAETPNWLCCTRYCPPRLPRLSSSNSRSRRAGRHARVPFTAAQASALEAAYARAPYLAPPALRALAAALQLRDDRIKIWFQNRRARERREKSVTISPPLPVTLPPSERYSSHTYERIHDSIHTAPTLATSSNSFNSSHPYCESSLQILQYQSNSNSLYGTSDDPNASDSELSDSNSNIDII